MKSLGQEVYEDIEGGGKQNFGPWEKAPPIVRRINNEHANLAATIVLAKAIIDYQITLSSYERVKLWEKIQNGYCVTCGELKNDEFCFCPK